MSLSKALRAAAGNAGAGESLYVEDVFSTYLYEGNGSTQTITNGIDLAGEGGLVWQKRRDGADDNFLSDTTNGLTYPPLLISNQTGALNYQGAYSPVKEFLSTGFNMDSLSLNNDAGQTFASWTFRKAEKFFDIVTYTGTGSAQAISHNLNGEVGAIFVKRTDSSVNWSVYHKDILNTKSLYLNLTNGATTSSAFNNTATSGVFYVDSSPNTNASGGTYVAYLFASDAGGFGDDGSESIIKCGSFTTSSYYATINLGFEPQWILYKRTDSSTDGDWQIADNMRGLLATENSPFQGLQPNLSNAESSSGNIQLTATGFVFGGAATGNYIYIAIRRPMKTPESGTEVFAVDTYNQTSASDPAFNLGGVVDFGLRRINNFESNWTAQTRLTGDKGLTPNATDAESTQNYGNWDNMVGWYQGASITPPYSQANWYGWNFKRATGFFDVVAYTGDGTGATTGRDINHNLGVVPDLMIIKKRNNTRDWRVGGPSVNFSSGDYEYNGSLNSDITFDGGNAGTAIIGGIFYYYRIPTIGHTATTFRVGNHSDVNASGDTYIAYLFATLAGVSKVGSYTGTGSNVDVDCGFSAGARFILIKRTDSTGDWYVWDSVRGIVAGNDPYLLLNSTAAEVTNTDYIDPLSSGFTVTSSAPAALNASGGNYIFLAIA